MTVIEYCCLVEGSESLHVIRPQSAGANNNQYVLIFEGARDWSLFTASGDWEYEAVSHCLGKAADHLADSNSSRTGSFSVGSLARWRREDGGYAVGAEVSVAKIDPVSGDRLGRFTIRLGHDAQEPFIRARTWSGIDDRTFRIYRTDEEMVFLGRLLQRLESASYEIVFESDRNDWFMPDAFRFGGDLGLLARESKVRISREHIADVCPGGFVKFWLALMDEIELPDVAQCLNCKGFFPRPEGKTWLKWCLGCYRKTAPTSYSLSEIDSRSTMASWLRCTSQVIDEAADSAPNWHQ